MNISIQTVIIIRYRVVRTVQLKLPGGTREICTIYCGTRCLFPGLDDLPSKADPETYLSQGAGEELDHLSDLDLDNNLSKTLQEKKKKTYMVLFITPEGIPNK